MIEINRLYQADKRNDHQFIQSYMDNFFQRIVATADNIVDSKDMIRNNQKEATFKTETERITDTITTTAKNACKKLFIITMKNSKLVFISIVFISMLVILTDIYNAIINLMISFFVAIITFKIVYHIICIPSKDMPDILVVIARVMIIVTSNVIIALVVVVIIFIYNL